MPRLATRLLGSIPSVAARAPAQTRTAVGNTHVLSPSDVKLSTIKAALYPSDGVSPSSSSPIGARHHKSEERLRAALPSAEAYETIERAWGLFRRRAREKREAALTAKFNAMKEACDELAQVAAMGNSSIYDRAMVRMAHGASAHKAAAQGFAQGKKKTQESRWLEARPEGLVPREQWVPTETRGVPWNYGWERPLNE